MVLEQLLLQVTPVHKLRPSCDSGGRPMCTHRVRVAMMIAAAACFAPHLHAQTVLQWNLKNNCAYDATCRNNEVQFIANLTPQPAVVAVQELPGIYASDFATSLGNATGLSWNFRYAAHKQPNCTSDFAEGVAIFTTFSIVDSETALFPFADTWVCKRAAVRVALSINGSTVQVFTSHMTT